MIGRVLGNTFRVGLVLLAALVAAVVANFVLLGVANGPNDPVGKLSPRAGLVQLPAVTPTTTAPTTPSVDTTQPREENRSDGASDD